MSYFLLACLLSIAASSIVASRRRVDRFYLVFGVIGGSALVFGIALLGISGNVAYLTDVGPFLLALVVAQWAFGLPRPIARRLGWGLRNREWEFDRRLYATVGEFDRLLRSRPAQADPEGLSRWRAQVRSRGPRLATRIRALRAPDRAWQELASDYAALCALVIEHIDDADEPGRRAAVERARADLARRRTILQDAYRAWAKDVLSGRDLQR